MQKPAENGESYIVYHFEMGAVDGIYSGIAFDNEACSDAKLDSMQHALGDKKGPATSNDAIAANPAIYDSVLLKNKEYENIAIQQPRCDGRGTELANNAIDALEIKEKAQFATDSTSGTYVYLNRGNEGSRKDAKKPSLEENKELAMREDATVKQQKVCPSRCLFIVLFVIVFLMAASGLIMSLLFMTGHVLSSKKCDSLNGDAVLAERIGLPIHDIIHEMKTEISTLKEELNLTRNELKKLKEEGNNRTDNLRNEDLAKAIADLTIKVNHSQNIAALWKSLNSTRQTLSDLHQKETSTASKLLELRTTLLSKGNDTQQQLHTVWRALNSSLTQVQHYNDTAALWVSLNSTREKLSTELHQIITSTNTELQQQKTSLWTARNYTEQELRKIWSVVNSSLTQILNATNTSAPTGPRGANGSQGLIGPQGPAGPMGVANFSFCQHVVDDSGGATPDQNFDQHIYAVEMPGKKIVGATCSTNFAAEYIFTKHVFGNILHYMCHCKGQSSLFIPSFGETTNCYIHYWECPA